MTCFAPARTANLQYQEVRSLWTYYVGLEQEQGIEGCKHAQDGCTASDIQDNLVLEDVSVLIDGISVRLCSNLVLLLLGRLQVSKASQTGDCRCA